MPKTASIETVQDTIRQRGDRATRERLARQFKHSLFPEDGDAVHPYAEILRAIRVLIDHELRAVLQTEDEKDPHD